jgi:ubiquinone/menaquinone biosynthesis C-methylase UbiE
VEAHPWFAAFYDRVDRAAQRGWLGERRRRLVGDAAGTVLEIGAGPGANLPHYRTAEHVVLTEPDPAMRSRLAARTPLARVRYELLSASAAALPMPDASVDVVVSAYVLCTVPDVQAALAEVRRVLRPGGELRFLEHVRPEGAAGRLTDRIAPLWRRAAAGCSPNRRTLEALEAAGYRVAAVDFFRPPVLLAGTVMPMIQGTALPNSAAPLP